MGAILKGILLLQLNLNYTSVAEADIKPPST